MLSHWIPTRHARKIGCARLPATSRRDRSQRQILRNAIAQLMVPSASVSKFVCNVFLVNRVLVVLAPFLKTWGQLFGTRPWTPKWGPKFFGGFASLLEASSRRSCQINEKPRANTFPKFCGGHVSKAARNIFINTLCIQAWLFQSLVKSNIQRELWTVL